MKHGKRPTRQQKYFMIESGLDPATWLVVKNTNDEMLLINRKGNRTKRILKR
jgi:hypothetical protein